jgi:hypothetical protein
MQRTPDRLSVGIVPEQVLNIGDTNSLSFHWLFGKDGGYVTRLKEDYAQGSSSDNISSAKAEARIMREIADWLESQRCDEFWTPRARQPPGVSQSRKQPSFCADTLRRFLPQINSWNN